MENKKTNGWRIIAEILLGFMTGGLSWIIVGIARKCKKRIETKKTVKALKNIAADQQARIDEIQVQLDWYRGYFNQYNQMNQSNVQTKEA